MPAFPMSAHQLEAIDEIGLPEDGMTYRQWLVGHLAAGLAANPHASVSRIAELAYQLSDEIIDRLDTTDKHFD
jgi:hypothetical protein